MTSDRCGRSQVALAFGFITPVLAGIVEMSLKLSSTILFSLSIVLVMSGETQAQSFRHYELDSYIDPSGTSANGASASVTSANGAIHSIQNVQDWEKRRENVLENLQLVMGQLPDRASLSAPLFEILQTTNLDDGIVRQQIRFQSESNDWVTAILLTHQNTSNTPRAAMLALHQTTSIGKEEPAGMGGSPNLHYGIELARRGYIVLIPDYPSFGEYAYDFGQHPEWKSGSLKAIWNNMRAIDLLQSLPEVDGERIGVIGHSLGGHNAIFTAVFDQRIKVVVSSCGFTRFHKYYGGNLKGWTSSRYMPAIDSVYHSNPDEVPFDFPELIAAIAPRAFFTSSPLQDDNFDCEGVRETIAEVKKIYTLYDAQAGLFAIYPASQHDFPVTARTEAYLFIDHHLRHDSPLERIDVSDKRLNELQLLGTHNSYHVAPDSVAMGLIRAAAPSEAETLDVTQPTLTEQLDRYGVRHVELDVYLDPKGTLYRKPAALRMAQQQQVEVPSFDPDGRMDGAGIKVLHSPDVDYRTTVYTFVDALTELRKWSDANPQHVTLFVLVELKSDSFSPLTRPITWDEAGFGELEREILSVWPRERILAPDDIRGTQATLREAVQGKGWPTVESQRGKIAFLLDNEGGVRDAYLVKSEILAGRLLFTSVGRDHPAAAWMKRNDPVGSFAEIESLVRDGFMIRTRADSGTREARENDPSRRQRAIESGAQLISTDFLKPDWRWSPYHVRLAIPSER